MLFVFRDLPSYIPIYVFYMRKIKRKKICWKIVINIEGDVEVEIQYFTSYFTVFQIPFVKNISSIILLRIRVNNLYFQYVFHFSSFTIEKLKIFFLKK